MKRFGNNDEFDGLEARLRDERPGPSDELVRRLAERSSSRRRRVVPNLRVGLATGLTACCVALVGALGGFNAPVNAAQDALNFKSAAQVQPAIPEYKPPKPPKPPKPCKRQPCGP